MLSIDDLISKFSFRNLHKQLLHTPAEYYRQGFLHSEAAFPFHQYYGHVFNMQLVRNIELLNKIFLDKRAIAFPKFSDVPTEFQLRTVIASVKLLFPFNSFIYPIIYYSASGIQK